MNDTTTATLALPTHPDRGNITADASEAPFPATDDGADAETIETYVLHDAVGIGFSSEA